MAGGTVYFERSCVKTLTAVEVVCNGSNQHEFNGVKELRQLFGAGEFSSEAIFTIRGKPLSCIAKVTWYDARKAHETRSEHRLYFQGNAIMMQVEEGDSVIVGFDAAGALHLHFVKA